MKLDDLSVLFQKDLVRLSDEMKQFKDTSNLWKTTGGISNTAGNLCLHINGNLNHFIGAIIGGSGYVRNRPAEFDTKDVPVDLLVEMTHATTRMLASTIDNIQPESLEKSYPIEVFGEPISTGYFLLHLHGHLNYHLGQINYLRRILES
jgi:hypothetical protein